MPSGESASSTDRPISRSRAWGRVFSTAPSQAAATRRARKSSSSRGNARLPEVTRAGGLQLFQPLLESGIGFGQSEQVTRLVELDLDVIVRGHLVEYRSK